MRWLDHHNIVIIIQIKWKKNEMIGSQEMPATSGGKGQNLSPGACWRSQPWLTPHVSLWLHPCYSIHTYTHSHTHSHTHTHTLTWWGEANAKIQGEDSYLQSQGDSPGQTPLHSLQKTSALGLPWWSSGKESTFQRRKFGFHPWFQKSPHVLEWLSPNAQLLSLWPTTNDLTWCSEDPECHKVPMSQINNK